MERDFMGLSSKEPLAAVKKEIDVDGSEDSACSKGPRRPWPFLGNVSALPHLVTPKVAVEDGEKKVGPCPHASPGFVTASSADAFNHSHKSSVGELQKTFNHNRHGGTYSSMTTHPAQHDLKPFSSPSKPVAVSLFHPFSRIHFTATGHELAAGSMTEQPHGGIPVTGANSMPPSGGLVAGITEECFRDNFKAIVAPSQLTIFYKGVVNIYNNVSPEKAQAIMVLAGDGSSMVSAIGQSGTQAQAPTPKLVVGDVALASQPMNTPPCSANSSPISVSSRPVHQSSSGSTSTDELVAAKSSGLSANAINSIRTVVTKTMMASAVPQARKASLARFLEKRKERVMSMAPYNLSQKPQECATPQSNGISVPASAELVFGHEK